MPGSSLTFGSTFAGIEGIGLGLEAAGMTCLWQAEIHPYRSRVLRERMSDRVPGFFPDVRLVRAGEVAGVDILAGGFPCSDVSDASSTKTGVDGERSGLWRELLRLVRELRPRYVLVENVAALLTRGLPRVLGDLAEVGYDAEWDCLPAAAFGSPHRRDRIFIVAYAHCERCPRGSRIFGTRGGPEPPLRRLVRGAGPGEAWPPEPDVVRMAHGVPDRVDRVEALGRAVVPRVGRHLGELIRLDADRRRGCHCW